MADQDRSLWDRAAIEEGIALITAALPRGPTGPYQLQAAIAAVHDEAASAEATDWPQIAALYGVLLHLDDNPVVALNHAVAVSMVAGPRAGLELLSVSKPTPGSTPTVASTRCAATSSRRLATMRRARGLPGRRPGGHQPPAAALPQPTGRSPAGAVGQLTATLEEELGFAKRGQGLSVLHPRRGCGCAFPGSDGQTGWRGYSPTGLVPVSWPRTG